MTGRACKAAADCTGFLYEVDKSVDLILHGHISDDGIDAFNEMKEKMEKQFEKWKEKYIDFED